MKQTKTFCKELEVNRLVEYSEQFIAGNRKPIYVSPQVKVHYVELEMDCMAVTSGATSSGTPAVTDWTDDTSTNYGDVSWP
jgi:hypothetical protein